MHPDKRHCHDQREERELLLAEKPACKSDYEKHRIEVNRSLKPRCVTISLLNIGDEVVGGKQHKTCKKRPKQLFVPIDAVVLVLLPDVDILDVERDSVENFKGVRWVKPLL